MFPDANALKKLVVAGALLASGLMPAIAWGATTGVSAASASVRAAIDAGVEKERKTYGGRMPVPAVLVGVWDGSGGTFVHAFGYADLATHAPLSPVDHFRIGSNTKTFVVSVILQLVNEGKLGLDDPLSRFDLGVAIPNSSRITVRELCDMRSGLFEVFDVPELEHMSITPQTKFDPRKLIVWAVKQRPYLAPGKQYHYTNTGYLILGLIIEKITGDSVGAEIRKRLLVPFGLRQTSYPQTQAMPEPWAHGYGLDVKHNWTDVSNEFPVSAFGAAGAMISDMSDMKRWTTLYVSGKASGRATDRAAADCIPTGVGTLAFGLGLGCSAGWYGYTGGLPGYTTANYYFPATGATIIAWATVQAHTPRPGMANALVRDIARVMTPGHVPFQNAGTPP